MSCRAHSLRRRLLVSALFCGSVIGQGPDGSKFDICHIRVQRILNGTEVFGDINNETISRYIYYGPVQGMNPEYARKSRGDFLTINTEGCRVLCGDPVDWYWESDISLTLGIISNWILPIIALLAALPYDSVHRSHDGSSRDRGRLASIVSLLLSWPMTMLHWLGAILNWLGSPPTALTATLFNIHQIRKCFHETLPSKKSRGDSQAGQEDVQQLKRDAYYVLSCTGQFDVQHTDIFLRTFVYGMLRPLCNVTLGEAHDTGETATGLKAKLWTQELLQTMAFQLRVLRRRGVFPTFISIILFFVAYAVSVAMAFADVGERTTAHSLAFGVLISWFPLFILFAFLDRNPVSADRTRKLLSRWMWNVNAVKQWEEQQGNLGPPVDPYWWSQSRESSCRDRPSFDPSRGIPLDTPAPHREVVAQQTIFDDQISTFLGQGRQIGYNGLAYAVLISVYNTTSRQRQVQPLETIVEKTRQSLNGHRPRSWWVLSLISLALVWLEIGMALMISYNIPTVGIGCRSMSYIVYGGLSTMPWIIHLLPWFKRPGPKRQAVCHVICLLSCLALVFISFAAFSGVLKNCLCRGGLSGYIDFENANFYKDKDHFDVAKWWTASAIVGALPVVLSFLAAIWLLMLSKVKILWQASDQESPHERDPPANMNWLR